MKTILKEEGYPLTLLKTYLAMVAGSVGSKMFRKLYVTTPDGSNDVIGDGDLACAFYVSSMLSLCGLIHGGVHTTVTETIQDLVASGWVEINAPKSGAVVVWESQVGTDGAAHRHIGIALSNMIALSNVSKLRQPGLHDMGCGKHRSVEKVYFHPKLENDTM
ncbi:MAG: hypothetical protein WAW13_01440 [Minisyncoccia bacterium]